MLDPGVVVQMLIAHQQVTSFADRNNIGEVRLSTMTLWKYVPSNIIFWMDIFGIADRALRDTLNLAMNFIPEHPLESGFDINLPASYLRTSVDKRLISKGGFL